MCYIVDHSWLVWSPDCVSASASELFFTFYEIAFQNARMNAQIVFDLKLTVVWAFMIRFIQTICVHWNWFSLFISLNILCADCMKNDVHSHSR